MADDIELALRSLGKDLDYPDAARLAEDVRRRIEAAPAHRPVPLRRRRFRTVALVAAAALVLGGAAVAVRFAIRGVDVVTTPTPPPAPVAPPGEGLALGDPISLDGARNAVPFPVRVPDALGEPGGVFLDHDVPDGRVTMTYAPSPDLPRDDRTGLGAIFMQFRGTIDEDVVLTKTFEREPPRIERVSVGDAQGLWIEGAHVLFLLDNEGRVREESVRIAGSVLLWQVGDVTLRLEADLDRDDAIRIAASAG